MTDAGTDPLRQVLVELEQVLRGNGAPVVEHLRPGLSGSAVEAAVRTVGLDPHPDLLTWWAWHDGTPTKQWWPWFCLLGGVWPMPLAVAVDTWHTRAEDPLWEEGIDFPRHLFPVAGAGDRAVVGVDTADGSVVVDDPHSPREPPFAPDWPSLDAMVQDMITMWRSGAVYMDPGAGPVADRSRWPSEVPRNSVW